jgi:large subunit ribosomal protein L23
MHLYEVLRRPIITEKATFLHQQDKYAFEVAKDATKPQIKQAVEKAFDVSVVKVSIMTVPGKTRRMGRREIRESPWKKAVVSLEPGHKIGLFEGM